MSPKASKYFLSEASFVWYGSPPTKILVKVVSFCSEVGCMTSRAPFMNWCRSIGQPERRRLAHLNVVCLQQQPSISENKKKKISSYENVGCLSRCPSTEVGATWCHLWLSTRKPFHTGCFFDGERNSARSIYTARVKPRPLPTDNQSASLLGANLKSSPSHFSASSSITLHLLLSFTTQRKSLLYGRKRASDSHMVLL